MCLIVLGMKVTSFTGLVRADPTRAHELLLKAGRHSAWELKYAAGYLGVSRATIYRLLARDMTLRKVWDAGRAQAVKDQWG